MQRVNWHATKQESRKRVGRKPAEQKKTPHGTQINHGALGDLQGQGPEPQHRHPRGDQGGSGPGRGPVGIRGGDPGQHLPAVSPAGGGGGATRGDRHAVPAGSVPGWERGLCPWCPPCVTQRRDHRQLSLAGCSQSPAGSPLSQGGATAQKGAPNRAGSTRPAQGTNPRSLSTVRAGSLGRSQGLVPTARLRARNPWSQRSQQAGAWRRVKWAKRASQHGSRLPTPTRAGGTGWCQVPTAQPLRTPGLGLAALPPHPPAMA